MLKKWVALRIVLGRYGYKSSFGANNYGEPLKFSPYLVKYFHQKSQIVPPSTITKFGEQKLEKFASRKEGKTIC